MWKENVTPKRGDLLRVNRGLYYHYGVYYENNTVFQFAGEATDSIENTENVMIRISPIEVFIKNSVLEVYEFSEEELKNTYPIEERIQRAKSELGNKGYDLVSNNCEDFANRVVYKVPPKDQADKIMDFLSNLFAKR